MEKLPSQEKERPDWVWFLLILYGFGVVINFAIILLMMLSSKNGQPDLVGIGIAVLVLVLRGVGLVRLFYFKTDGWLYLAVALFIIVANDALDLILGGSDFFLQRHPIPQTLGSIATATAIIIYAFNLVQKEKSPGA